MGDARAKADAFDNALIVAWARLRVVTVRCGFGLMTTPLAGRRILIGMERARLYALRTIFTD